MNVVLGVIQAVGALAAAAAAVLAWVAKIRWSEQYREAKEAQIQTLKTAIEQLEATKEVQIEVYKARLESLRQLDSRALRERFLAQKNSLEEMLEEREEYAERVQRRLNEAEEAIEELKSEKQLTQAELKKAAAAKERLEAEIATLRSRLEEAREAGRMGLESEAPEDTRIKIDFASFRAAEAYEDLRTFLVDQYFQGLYEDEVENRLEEELIERSLRRRSALRGLVESSESHEFTGEG